MKKNIKTKINPYYAHVEYEDAIASLPLGHNSDGKREITFSIPLRAECADIINESGIADVEEINFDKKTIVFRASSFYETHLMIELLADILIRLHVTH